ncbi:DUF4158 domain-containing protein [Enterobacter huaxiensis]|uniref:DUF4158 domain-containing protein n=1 Tax=Enterobacter huaxiensis TaxID=2494702 RepID=UPI000E735E08|nr:DUF4158 domain-containing protein [Enterobacter huaxiensis]UNC52689.1 DUF4158 domain-containing protein [Enterobacter huaxiensis]
MLLCTVRCPGCFSDLTTIIPIAVINFLAEQMHIESGSKSLNTYNSGKQRRQNIDDITKKYGYTEFTDTRVAFSLTRWLYSLYWTGTSRPDIRCSNAI